MRLVLATAALAALAGCQSVEQLRALAPQQPDYEICRAVMAGGPNMRQVAWEEQQRRGLDCAPYAGAIAQREAASNAMALQLMQQSRPQPLPMPQMPQTVRCNSYRYGNQVQTTCN